MTIESDIENGGDEDTASMDGNVSSEEPSDIPFRKKRKTEENSTPPLKDLPTGGPNQSNNKGAMVPPNQPVVIDLTTDSIQQEHPKPADINPNTAVMAGGKKTGPLSVSTRDNLVKLQRFIKEKIDQEAERLKNRSKAKFVRKDHILIPGLDLKINNTTWLDPNHKWFSLATGTCNNVHVDLVKSIGPGRDPLTIPFTKMEGLIFIYKFIQVILAVEQSDQYKNFPW